MQKLLLPIIVMTVLVVGATSCSSINARSNGTHSGLYPGLKAIQDDNSTAAYKIVDGSLSFALDTALLPIDILGAILGGRATVADDENGTKDDNATDVNVPELPNKQ